MAKLYGTLTGGSLSATTKPVTRTGSHHLTTRLMTKHGWLELTLMHNGEYRLVWGEVGQSGATDELADGNVDSRAKVGAVIRRNRAAKWEQHKAEQRANYRAAMVDIDSVMDDDPGEAGEAEYMAKHGQ